MHVTRARSRLATAAVCVAMATMGMNTTAIGVATRGIAEELAVSLAELEWIIGAYLVVGAAFALIGGRMGDVVGRSRTFLTGLAIFAIGCVIAALAPGAVALIVGRAIQGLGAALVLPATIEVIVARAPAQGPSAGLRVRGLVYAVSFGIGPLIGGVLTDTLSWRAIFWAELALILLAALLALPLFGQPAPGTKPVTRDFRGAALAAMTILLAMIGASRARTWGWWSWPTALVAVTVAGLGALTASVESRVEHPLLHPGLLRDRVVLGANVATLGASIGMIGLVYFFDLFAQSAVVFDSTALGVAAALLPFTVSLLLFAPAAAYLSRRIGFRGPVVVGLGLSIVGFAWLSRTTIGTTESQLVLPLALCGVGAGLANAGLTTPAVLTQRSRVDEAAGLTSLTRFVGSAIAVLIGTTTYLAVGTSRRRDELAIGGVEPADLAVGRTAFTRALATLHDDLRGPFTAATRANTIDAFTATMRVTAIVLTAVVAISVALLASARPPATSTPGPDEPPTPPTPTPEG